MNSMVSDGRRRPSVAPHAGEAQASPDLKALSCVVALLSDKVERQSCELQRYAGLLEQQGGKLEQQVTTFSQKEQDLRALFNRADERADKVANRMAMVVFSGDLDKLLAALIIATGAAASGMEVSLFFTFWGTTALRSPKPAKKAFLARLFGWVLPKGADQVKLSKLHFAGAGTAAMKHLMNKKGVASLPELLEMAGELDVHIDVCTMSMDLMGIAREELIDYPNIGYCGVASFVEVAASSSATLFI